MLSSHRDNRWHAARGFPGSCSGSCLLDFLEEAGGSGVSTVGQITWLSMALWRQLAPGVDCTRSDPAGEPHSAWLHAPWVHLLCAPHARLLHEHRSRLLGEIHSCLTYSCTPAVRQSAHVSLQQPDAHHQGRTDMRHNEACRRGGCKARHA